jgi:Flp pilus assembly protein TadB
MTHNPPKGAISRKIEETLERIDKLIEDRQRLSDRVQQVTDESRGGNK